MSKIKIGNLRGKLIVEGDSNETTINEIHISSLSGSNKEISTVNLAVYSPNVFTNGGIYLKDNNITFDDIIKSENILVINTNYTFSTTESGSAWSGGPTILPGNIQISSWDFSRAQSKYGENLNPQYNRFSDSYQPILFRNPSTGKFLPNIIIGGASPYMICPDLSTLYSAPIISKDAYVFPMKTVEEISIPELDKYWADSTPSPIINYQSILDAMGARDIFNRGCELLSRQVGYPVDDDRSSVNGTIDDELIVRDLLLHYANLCEVLSGTDTGILPNAKVKLAHDGSNALVGYTSDPHIMWTNYSVDEVTRSSKTRFYIKSLSTASNHFMRFTYMPNIDSIDIFLGTMDSFPIG